MAVDFPNTPTVGQVFTSSGVAFVWDGAKWVAQSSATQFGVGTPIWLTQGDAPPANPQPGMMYFDTAGMQMYYYYQDPDSAEWVPVSNQGSPIGNAASLQNVGRNYVHNSKFNINQRGGPWTWNNTGNYTLDRWAAGTNGDTLVISQYTMSDADRSQIGDESAIYALEAQVTGTSGAAAYSQLSHWIEDVHRLSGKTVTVSFWAWTSVAMNVGVEVQQYFGGGSSSPAWIGAGQSIAAVPTWRRYAVTFTLPSVTGKITDNTSCTGLLFWLSSGTTQAANAGNIGVQSGAVFFWGVQLELGSTASQFQPIDPVLDLQQCQRFYLALNNIGIDGYGDAGIAISYCLAYPVTMRAVPGVGFTGVTSANTSGPNAGAVTNASLKIYIVTSALGSAYANFNMTATADL